MILVITVVIGTLNLSVLATTDAWYPFNGNANDESGNVYHGTVSGSTLCADRFGTADSAYSFPNTSDYIEIPNFPSASTYVDFSAWVRLDAEGIDDGGFILNKGKYGIPETYSILVTNTDHYPEVNVHVGGGYYNAVGTEPLVLDEWTHIRGVYNGIGPGAGLTLYVNGTRVDYTAVSGLLDQNSESLWFGVDYNNTRWAWDGSIDDVSIIIPDFLEGDANGDGVVSAGDYAAVQANFGNTNLGSSAATEVPEPATLSLLTLGGIALLRRRGK